MGDDVQFDWDEANIRHLKRHKVSPQEFEQVIAYRSLGATDRGRILTAVWTARNGKIRAITAYPAGAATRKLYLGFTR